MGDILVLAILAVLCFLAILYLWRNRGKHSCGGNCGTCGSNCHLSDDLKKARIQLAKERESKNKMK